MSFETRSGGGHRSDEEFERALIDSARGDELPEARTAEAWSAFAGKLSAAAGALPGVEGASAARRAAEPAVTAAVRAGAGAATRWLLVGALGGGALTAAFIWRHPSAGSARPASAATVAARASEETLAERPDRARVAPAALDHGAPREARRSAGQGARVAARGQGARGASAPSTLAAEVAALDAARGAAAAGDPDATLRLVDRYHYDFPEGELAADAEVVAIEALASKGARDELAPRVSRFLSRHPNDPHVAEVRRLSR